MLPLFCCNLFLHCIFLKIGTHCAVHKTITGFMYFLPVKLFILPGKFIIMQWLGRRGSSNVEDRRGLSGGGMAAGGGVIGVIIILFILF